MTKTFETEILIVGGGAAGLAAATSATGKDILLADDNPQLGGQIWRAELGKIKSPDARKLLERTDSRRVSILNNASVFGLKDKKILLAETPVGAAELKFEKLILATGARERFLPFPNWTLPNIFGAGGLQALVKSGFAVKDKRVIVAGSGPLLLAVADYLKSKGAKVLFIAEQAPAVNLARFGFGLLSYPKKIGQAIALRTKLLGVKFQPDCYVAAAHGNNKLEAVTMTRRGKSWRVECDLLACGFHLVPNTELARLIGCRTEKFGVAVDEFQQTSVPDVFCAGEPTGIGGLELSLLEGKIAGLAASGETERSQKLLSERRRLKKFAGAMNEAFALRRELKHLPEAETIVCRCEDVRLKDLQSYGSFREAKLQTRCGMGSCQGRICGAATEFLFDWEDPGTRLPVFPVKLETLGD